MRTFYSLILFFCLSFSVFSQEENSNYERIKSLKIGYITEKVSLTPSEAKAFWPIYDKYSQKLHDLHSQIKTCRKKGCEKKENLTEKEALDILKKDDDLTDLIWKTSKEKDKELLKVISAQKLLLLKHTEREFHQKLIKQYKDAK